MQLVLQYEMVAVTFKGQELGAALAELAAQVRQVPGCADVQILQCVEDHLAMTMLEFWDSEKAHAESTAHLPKGAFNKVMSFLARPPGRRRLRNYPQPSKT